VNLLQRLGMASRLVLGGMRSASLAIIPRWMVGQQAWQNSDVADFPLAFKLIPDIYSCISLIQNEIASLPLKFYRVDRGGERTELEPTGDRARGNVADLWTRANDHETGYNIQEQLAGSLLIWGNAYLFLEDFGGALPRELFVLLPPRVNPILNASGAAEKYALDVGAGPRKEIAGDRIIWTKAYDPFGGGLGMSPLEAARLTYETQRDMGRMQRQLHQRGGMPPGYFVTEETIDAGEREAAQQALAKQFKGSSQGAWDALILTGNLTFKPASLTLSEMQFLETAALHTEDILKIFHIPPTVYGIKRGGALGDDGADMEELRFYQQCVKAWTRRLEGSINEFLLPRFAANGGKLVAEFDYAQVLAYQDLFLSQAKAGALATGAPVLTVEEFRKRLGLPAEPEDGKLLIPFNLLPRDATPPEPAPAPATNPASEEPQAASGARDRMRALAARDLKRHERVFRRGLGPFFTQQETRVVDRLREQGHRSLERVLDIDMLLEDSEGDRELLKRLIRAVVMERGQEVLDELAAEIAFTAFTERADAFVRTHSAELSQQVNKTTRLKLRETLAQGVAADESIVELVARVREVYTERRSSGAANISRTETASAYNHATFEAYDQSDVVATKSWLSARDEAVREAHAEADTETHSETDGQTIPLNQQFELTDENGEIFYADYPGDRRLPASLRCNCRCTLAPGTPERVAPGSLAAALNGTKPHQRARRTGKVGKVTLKELFDVAKR
jgi:HK97 family phage portal protein